MTEQTKWNKSPIIESPDHRKFFDTAAEVTKHLAGPVLEFGVMGGGTSQLLSKTFPDNTIYGFDSRQGLPEDDFPGGWPDFKKGAYLSAKPTEVEKQCQNVKYIDGWFKDSLPNFILHNPAAAKFVVIDCDIYSSTKDVFDNIQVQVGTVIYFDEYKEYTGWERREFAAFMEFIERTGFDYDYILRTRDGGHAMVQLK